MKEKNFPRGYEKVKFAMAFHAFQPVFNFEGEVEKAFDLSYGPFLAVLEKFPSVKATFHFSGNMLDWLEEKKPEYIETLKKMRSAGQIEIMGGGYFEPIMPAIPRQDAAEQIKMMSRLVERIFGEKPSGAWTTERVWHRSLADIYSAEGIKYTILDDNHLLSSYSGDKGLFRPCVTYGDEGSVTACPASTKLRYLMPFSAPERTVEYIKNAARDVDAPCFFFADDLEKFGAWPRTHTHVYRKKWLERFFTLLERESSWLETSTYSEVASLSHKEDIGVLSPASYSEMEDWSEGSFGNFMKKYPESGRMYERMLEVSGKISEKSLGAELPRARKELFKAQTNCPYWHGTFGGVYLPHLRSGVYSHIIRAEKILESGSKREKGPVFCAENVSDKKTGESVIGNQHLKLYISPENGASIEEIDLKDREINLVNSFSRRREPYHRKLERGHWSVTREARKKAETSEGSDVDIHEILGVGEKGLEKVLAYDGYRRSCFITRVSEGHVKWDIFASSGRQSNVFFGGKYTSGTAAGKDLITRVFSAKGQLRHGVPSTEIEVEKKITLGTFPAIGVEQTVRGVSDGESELGFAMEFNFLVWDANVMKGPRMSVCDEIELTDRYSGLEIRMFMDRPLKVWTYPVYTVNETERGLGKTFQGSCVVMGDNFIIKGRDERKICAAIYVK